jgi:hypothetical protein
MASSTKRCGLAAKDGAAEIDGAYFGGHIRLVAVAT